MASADVIEQMMLERGYSRIDCNDMPGVSYVVSKTFPIDVLIERLKLPNRLAFAIDEGHFEYYPEVKRVRLWMDVDGGRENYLDAMSDDAQRMLALLID